ncbi:14137_t:CDS:2 [Funneliformis caledonium]|uniref:14137_t:CDS:1 n=1 Tax=Funneliformis caledonium TaxID=1117310 RepID=A0A9N9F165_9GLOM|nr:14137_t:CDS:2 [Funneliformis caledonium]
MSNLKYKSKERIILNVGGIKYETYRSTLTAYPETMLGTMFEERNKELLHPTNGNEYYIDRNGRLFYCILQFYRTGKIPSADKAKCAIPITQKELDAELDYFMIPRPKRLLSKTQPQPKSQVTKLSLRSRTVAAELDDFITALKTAINRAILYFQKRFIMSKGLGFNVTLEMAFYTSDRMQPVITVLPTTIGKSPVPQIAEVINQPAFGTRAYALLNGFGDKIGEHLEESYPGLCWDLLLLKICSDSDGSIDSMYRVRIQICDEFDYEEIIKNCCLSTTSLKYCY